MNIKNTIIKANKFIDELENSNGFKLFKRSEVVPYARCFVIFTKYLTKQFNWLEKRKYLIDDLNFDLYKFYQQIREKNINWIYDKSYLQLFTLTLSALNIFNGKLDTQNLEVLKKILNVDIITSLKKRGVDKGEGQSGNYSMFIAILNIYANDYLNINRSSQIKKWIEFNKKSINSNGFWGANNDMDYLQFQNGYHQYEIFEYLKITNIPWSLAGKNTLIMADKHGRFAPYPGGGSCYDYDAVFILTSKFIDQINQSNTLVKTLKTIIRDQNFDGGFCETRHLKYHGLPHIINIILHIINQPSHIRLSSTFLNLNLSRYKHRNMITHWSRQSRKWNESSAFDTFFRLKAIYRICNYLSLEEKSLFKINNFPGIS